MDLESGSIYWLPQTRQLPPQRAVLIELSRERDSVLFEVLPSDRAGGRTRYEYLKRNWAVALIEPYYS